jgi:hypothetical protein
MMLRKEGSLGLEWSCGKLREDPPLAAVPIVRRVLGMDLEVVEKENQVRNNKLCWCGGLRL